MNTLKEIVKTIADIEKHCGKQLLDEIKHCDREDLCLYHYSLGVWIRNRILLPESTIYKIFDNAGFENPDAISARLIELVYIDVVNKK